MEAAIAKAWELHQDTMQERLTVLEAAVSALTSGQLSPELQHAGCSQAHKLAGSFLVLTIHEEIRIKQDAFKVGADDFISKSAMVTDLPMKIKSRLQHMQI